MRRRRPAGWRGHPGGWRRTRRRLATATITSHVATTFDLTGIRPGGVVADTRTPYGDLAWDGDENRATTVVDGVGWGDRYKFITTSAPLTMNSKWDYAHANTVPYVLEWTTKTDA